MDAWQPVRIAVAKLLPPGQAQTSTIFSPAFAPRTEALIAQIRSVNAAEEKLLGLADEGNYTELKQVLGDNNVERAVQYACAGK